MRALGAGQFNPPSLADEPSKAEYKVGEDISPLAMCIVFLQYPVLEWVIAEEAGLLITYRGFFHDEDENTAVDWIGGDAFLNAYNEVSIFHHRM